MDRNYSIDEYTLYLTISFSNNLHLEKSVINPSGVDSSAKIPFFIQFLKRISPIGMAIEALCIAEYKGMSFSEKGMRWSLKDLPRMGGLALVRNGDQVIDALGLNNKSYEGLMNNMLIVSAMNLCLSWFGLSCCSAKFTNARDTSISNKEEKDKDEQQPVVPITFDKIKDQ